MSNIPSKEDIQCGQAVYTQKFLPFYDLIVTKFSNRFAWQCSKKTLIKFFQDNISANHLDIGVGTGYFLNALSLTPGKQRIGLLDLNKECLDFAAKKIDYLHPEIYQHDAFESFSTIKKKFDSVSLNYVLHCLPGTLTQKAITFDHIKAVLNPGGILFGSTLLGQGLKQNWLAKKLTRIYNQQKLFCNLNDNQEILLSELKKRFAQVQIKIQGCVALFVAKN